MAVTGGRISNIQEADLLRRERTRIQANTCVCSWGCAGMKKAHSRERILRDGDFGFGMC